VHRHAGFPRAQRLRRSWEFRRANRCGRRVDAGAFIVLIAPTAGQQGRRLGVTVSRKVGDAVRRNRLKRRIREWFRTRSHLLPPDVDIVVIARRSAVALSAEEVDAVLTRALRVVEVFRA
jgi:ribonuclease P protein component